MLSLFLLKENVRKGVVIFKGRKTKLENFFCFFAFNRYLQIDQKLIKKTEGDLKIRDRVQTI